MVLDIETFAHVVAHDLKAPLNGIAALVDFVVEDYADRLDDEGRAQLRLIQTMATRSVVMVDALRQLARIATVPINLRPLDLSALARRAATAAIANVTEVTVDVAIGTSLPPVVADPALVPLLLDHLFANAVLFGAQPQRRIAFDRAATAHPVPAGQVAFALRDDGIGIATRHRAEVFDMFKRLHNSDRFGGGVGAGLALARAVVERHGGAIWADAPDGPGTVITFTLPAAPDGHAATEH